MDGRVLVTDRFVLFWRGWPSQWIKSCFRVDGIQYNCAEQFMMAEKARVFGDGVTLAKILASTSPKAQKALGRQVKDFDEKTWNGVCRGIVYFGNLARFSQDDALAAMLMETGSRVIVEASPVDHIWGIGLEQADPRAQDPSQWLGTNWLGIALMQVRNELARQRGLSAPPFDAELRAQLDRRIAIAKENA